MPRTRPADLDALRAEFAAALAAQEERHRQEIAEVRRDMTALKDLVVVEITSLRMAITAQGIRPPSSVLDDGCVSVQEYAEANCISPEGVLTRIRRRQLSATKRGGRWRINLHGLNSRDGHPEEAVGLDHEQNDRPAGS